MPVMSIRQRIDRFFCRNTQDVLAIINDKNFLLKNNPDISQSTYSHYIGSCTAKPTQYRERQYRLVSFVIIWSTNTGLSLCQLTIYMSYNTLYVFQLKLFAFPLYFAVLSVELICSTFTICDHEKITFA